MTIFPVLFAALLVTGCAGTDTTAPVESTEAVIAEEDTSTNTVVVVEEEFVQQTTDASVVMLGTWKGEMNGKALTVVIEKVDGNNVTGYNILGSNRRDLTGTFTEGIWDQTCSEAFEATLSEPGDDEWDGVFTITFVGVQAEYETADGDLECEGGLSGSEAIGEWQANKGGEPKRLSMFKE